MNSEQYQSERIPNQIPQTPQTPQTPNTPRYSPRPAFQRTDFSRVSIGRGRSRNSLRQVRPGPQHPPVRPGGPTSAPSSPALRNSVPAPRPLSDSIGQPPATAPVSSTPPSFTSRPGPRTRGRPASFPDNGQTGPRKMAGGGQSWQKDAADQNFDYMFKLLIIGNSSVGKTSFLFRYADDSFTSAFVSTVGIDFKVKTVFRQDKRVKLQIWDTAGQERYRTITTAYYRGAMGFILMYDVTNEESFSSVHDWCTQIKTYSWDNAQVILVGNKCDMEDERVISYERGKQLADSLGLEFFETSAKENINVRAVFERLVDMICDKMSESLDADPGLNSSKGTRLTDTAQPSNVNCNC